MILVFVMKTFYAAALISILGAYAVPAQALVVSDTSLDLTPSTEMMVCAVLEDNFLSNANLKSLSVAQKKRACKTLIGSRNPISTNVSLPEEPIKGDTLVISWPPGGTVTATVNSVDPISGLVEITITGIQGNVPGLKKDDKITINATW
jgi:hypothetical protein